jgi:hypothetical protein
MGEVKMARKVILYFDDQTDALRFALAAGSVMAGEEQTQASDELIQEMQRASRVTLASATNPGAGDSAQDTSAPS